MSENENNGCTVAWHFNKTFKRSRSSRAFGLRRFASFIALRRVINITNLYLASLNMVIDLKDKTSISFSN